MNATPTSVTPAAAGVSAIAQAYAAADATAALQAIDAYAHGRLEHALCTVNRFDADTMRVVRLYSSNPNAYPPGGSKDTSRIGWAGKAAASSCSGR